MALSIDHKGRLLEYNHNYVKQKLTENGTMTVCLLP